MRRDRRSFRRVLAMTAVLAVSACTEHRDERSAPFDRAETEREPGDAPAAYVEASAPMGTSSDDAGAQSRCPSGAVLVHAAPACPGALAAPPSMLASLEGAAPGAVLSLEGTNEAAAPCWPVDVCAPSDAPTLFFSDSPEAPAVDGVLYADELDPGPHRLFLYHANGGTVRRKVSLVVLNASETPTSVVIERRGLASPSSAYLAIGKSVLLDWWTARPAITVPVPARTRVVLDPELDAMEAENAELVHAIYDVRTTTRLKVSAISLRAGMDSAAATAGLSLLPRDNNHQRGTFPRAERLFLAADPAGTSGIRRIRVGVAPVDPPLEGIDRTTGEPQRLAGNYGVVMRFRFGLGPARPVGLSPRGGSWAGATEAPDATPMPLPATSTALGATTHAIALGSTARELVLVSAGGSNLPIDVFVASP